MIKILQVNGYETPGSRFHGLSITPLLKKYGIKSSHLVWEKDTDNPNILTFNKEMHAIYSTIEKIFSLQSVLYPYSSQMLKMPAFKEADLLHLHIIHSGYFSFRDLPLITNAKPTVWTLHDPWALTGHCIHPLDCKRWMIGCGNCPDLKSEIPISFDTTQLLFGYKQEMYKKSKLDIIVASQWMLNMVQKSPMFKNAKIHHIPFGIDLKFFSPAHTKKARKNFSILDDTIVISFRGSSHMFKGINYIIQALEKIKTDKPICLLTIGKRGDNLLDRFRGRFQVIEVEWSNDQSLVRDAIAASDIFLMPSIAEAFGMMAIEALACGKPIIVFEGTSLPEITFAPDVGIAVPTLDSEGFYQALQRLIDSKIEREERGKKGRKISELHYSDKIQVQRLVEVYKKVINQVH